MAKTANEIREEFLRFFEERGHRRVKSSSVVPDADPTLMFANAGMVPFKRVFLGEEVRDYTRATTSQKCIRVSGKHNDLENVGRTPRHHTFFEMLGNFSFGDYFKADAIEYAWELLTGKMGFSQEELAVSVFRDDDEAYDLWRDAIGLPESRLYRLDEKENFWAMGDTGPCGPCSEIHFDFGVEPGCTSPICDPSCECGRWIELWNLVFMQFNRDESGEMTPLPRPSIDTGGGLERWAAVLQGHRSTWESDSFTPLISRASDISGVALGDDPEKDVSLRVVSDHARTLAILIGDGVLPANAGRGYVARRILRRGARHGVLLGLDEPFLYRIADKAIDELGGAYPDLEERRAYILERIQRDEERFATTLSKGLALLEDEIREAKEKGQSSLDGQTVFKLYDTFGFPLDLTADILVGHDMAVDQAGFDGAMQAQRDRARAAWVGSGDEAVAEVYGRIAANVTSQFRGYEASTWTSRLVALLVEGKPADVARKGDEVELIFEETPFYAESGGQLGDRGVISSEAGRVDVRDTQKPVDGLFVHKGVVVEGEIRVDSEASLQVDTLLREATVRNHTGTHLLHAALRKVLGPQAMQKGSLVGPDRLRFDFTHDSPLTDDEIERIEDFANRWIEENSVGTTRLMSYDDAVAAGAIAIFDEKYGDEVRVVSFGERSTELCGGTHVEATGDIGLLKVISESGIAAGVRRIEALTGLGALEHIREQEQLAREAADLLKVPLGDLPSRVEKLLAERRQLERELEQARTAQRGDAAGDLLSQARDVDGAKVLGARVDDVDAKSMRAMVDDLRNRLGTSAVLLMSETGGKVLLAVGVTKDATDRWKAGDLIREVAGVVGGGGGGRPDFAQAGGKDASKIDAAIDKFLSLCGTS
ncbi:MAG: alanine--tRNA ligase [Deltaproteobacteria bacterium]|nr:alanine--tRNA ligase [Deltaproteobacteria bacterium]MBW2385264.1 alanine--tRNA ligase [Deltaproteobacteria bacterium]